MHRAGTTMLTAFLEELGLFVGAKKEINNESVFFLRLNEWILKQANTTWDNTYNFKFINDDLKRIVKRVINYNLKGTRRIEFLGLKRFLRYKDIRDLNIPWGWKDPRNSFTIDIWKEIFPNAKILHIYRNPLDVAESLRLREEKIKSEFGKTLFSRVLEFLLIDKIGYQNSYRVLNIHEGIKLWEEYVRKSFQLNDEFSDRILHIKYEDFLENPQKKLNLILDFLDLRANKQKILEVARKVRIDRRYTFLKNEKLVEIYNQIREREIMQRLNYNNIEIL